MKKYHISGHSLVLLFDAEVMRDEKQLSEYDIEQYDEIIVHYSSTGGGFIDNLKDESKSEIAQKIGFDMNLIKRNELNINLIHFDLNMTNGENYRYFNNFKVDVVGGFHATDDTNIFKKFLEKISKKNIPFLVVSSGSSAKDILPICNNILLLKRLLYFV